MCRSSRFPRLLSPSLRTNRFSYDKPLYLDIKYFLSLGLIGGKDYKKVVEYKLVLSAIMVDWWWSLLGAAVPAVVAGQAFRMKKRRGEEQRLKSARGREKSSDDIFVCERVCTSKRMLKKVGAFSKEPTLDTCVTVCGVSQLDACADACARTVCVNQHQVPNWNDICLRRCQSECLKLSNSSAMSS